MFRKGFLALALGAAALLGGVKSADAHGCYHGGGGYRAAYYGGGGYYGDGYGGGYRRAYYGGGYPGYYSSFYGGGYGGYPGFYPRSSGVGLYIGF